MSSKAKDAKASPKLVAASNVAAAAAPAPDSPAPASGSLAHAPPAAVSPPVAAATATTGAPVAAPVEDDFNDGGSIISTTEESTASITSSIQQYRVLNGRRYHSDRFDAQYWGSNDDAQNELLDIMHHFLLVLLDGALYKAPIEPQMMHKVVDIGTGTGVWAIDFADAHPNVSVVGTDISPIQPTWVPPNVEFQIDDCCQPWTFPPNSVDYIHIRWMTGTVADWEAVYREAYKALKPGGVIETVEPSTFIHCDDGSMPPDSAFARWPHFFVQTGSRIGRCFTIVEDGVQRAGLAAAGFEKLDSFTEKAPIGPWRGDARYDEAGRYLQFGLERDFEGMTMLVATLLGWTAKEVKVYVAKMRKELHAGQFHAYFIINYVWARKPLEAEA